MISPINRRSFIAQSSLGLAALTFPMQLFAADRKYTVQQIIDIIMSEVKRDPFEGTVDTLKSGSPSTVVTGVVTTMFATIDVIKKAIDAKANFIIAHEPTFYNHQDQTDWLADSDTYKFKKELLDKNGIAVWRFHDFWHTQMLDGVREGVLQTIDWKKYQDASNVRVVNIPGSTLSDVISHVKSKLGIKELRFIGEPTSMCKKVLLMPGASGGRNQISEAIKVQPDLVICGEVSEWETAEFIRDSRATGKNVSLIVLGHAESEEPGMKFLVNWLKPKIEPISVTHIPSGNPFSFK